MKNLINPEDYTRKRITIVLKPWVISCFAALVSFSFQLNNCFPQAKIKEKE